MKRIQTLSEHLRPNATSSGAPTTPAAATGKNEKASASSTASASATPMLFDGYRYTRQAPGCNLLSKEERDQYERDGYLVKRGLVSEANIDKYVKRFRYLVAHPEERPVDMTVVRDISLAKSGIKKEDANTEEMITKFQDFVNEEQLFEFCREEQIHEVVESIVGKGSGLQAMHTMLINKPPDTGKGTSIHPLHQDLWYFSFRPAEKIVAAWCAMEKITLENGCLVVVPGSHKTELLKHGYPAFDVNKAYHSILGLDPKLPVVPLPMEKGDVVFFHPLLWHGSGPNFSKTTRKAISCHFASTDCVYIDVKGTIQEEIEKEIKDMAKTLISRRGVNMEDGGELDIDLSDLWTIRSKVVRGDEYIQKLQPGGKIPE